MNEKILYLECASGISGDMTVAALLDLGADRAVLENALESLPLSGYSIEIKDVYKSGIRACDFNVILDAEYENHDHDMEYLHGHIHSEGMHTHTTGSDTVYTHSHCASAHMNEKVAHAYAADADSVHTHSHCTSVHSDGTGAHAHAAGAKAVHTHSSRNLQDITEIIRAGHLTENASGLAIRIFEILAQAEARVHGKPIDEVHFHEVGAVDSIVDIVAAAVCLDNLHPDQIVVSALTEGCGQIRCQHGLIPVPVPAVTAISEQEGLVLRLTDIQGELVTPTGAAIAAAVRSGKKLPKQFQIRKIGLGAGKRNYATAGILRAMLIEAVNERTSSSDKVIGKTYPSGDTVNDGTSPSGDNDTILVLETNIDDCTGEALAFTMQQLMAAGALDSFYIPVYMKKNRPAWLLKTICHQEDRKVLESIIFQNTTTIGIRRQVMQRSKLNRRIVSVVTPWGTADIKCCDYDGSDSTRRFYPENDSVSRLAAENGIGFAELYGLLQSYAREHISL